MIDMVFDYTLAYTWSLLPLRGKHPDVAALLERGYVNDGGKGSWKPLQTQRATEEDLQAWFSAGRRNVGLVTGKLSGIVVLDVDGEEGLKTLAGLGLPRTAIVRTGNGKHYYFRYPEGAELRNFAKRLPGLDLRAEGGYVVLPPSIHPDTHKPYEWEVAPWDVGPLPEPPQWLLEAASESAPALAPLPAVVSNSLSDAEIVRRICAKHKELWDGDTNGYTSDSEADLALVSHLVYWTSGDLERVERLFGQSGRAREKWTSRPDYRQRTIAKAFNSQTRLYDDTVAVIIDPETGGVAKSYNLTELGNAERMVNMHADRLRFVVEWGVWTAWDGQRWKPATTGEATSFAVDVVRSLYSEAAEIEDDDARIRLVKHATKSESRRQLDNMLELAGRQPQVEVRVAQLDVDPLLLNVRNGVLNLRTLELQPPRQADLLTKLAPVTYVPEAKAPLWMAFLNRIFSGDEGLIAYVQRAVGYSLTGMTTEKALFFLYGPGGDNGKSTFVETIRALMGDYGLKFPASMLMSKPSNAIPNDVAQLPGVRLAIGSETRIGDQLDEAQIKDLTGNDTIAARKLHREWFEFKPTHKLWMYGNHRPKVRDMSAAIWRRINLIPFMVTIPKAEQDPQLMQKLSNEFSGILNWAIEGYQMWSKFGLQQPQSVIDATDDYRSDMDVLQPFFLEYCILDETQTVQARDLYDAYVAWCQDNGQRQWSNTAFGRTLVERGFVKKRTSAGIVYEGIGLKEQSVADVH